MAAYVEIELLARISPVISWVLNLVDDSFEVVWRLVPMNHVVRQLTLMQRQNSLRSTPVVPAIHRIGQVAMRGVSTQVEHALSKLFLAPH